jgi:NADH:ubiquinone oxidoreductase subunit E
MEEKINIKVCVGTYCYVMGGHQLREIKTLLPEYLQDKVKVEASVCLGCDELNSKPNPPYVKINEELMASASLEKIILKLELLTNYINQ